MRKDKRLSKEDKVKAQRLANLLNDFLEKDLSEKDLSTPNKVTKYWKILKNNLWQREMEPPGPFCLLRTESMDTFTEIPGLHRAEDIGSANTILWLHQMLKFCREQFENPEKFYDLNEDDYAYDDRDEDGFEKWYPYLQYSGDWRLYSWDLAAMRTELKNPINFPYELVFNSDLNSNTDLLKRCNDNLCGKWFVRRPNKKFCCHGCAARYYKRMKVGKGDLQLSYRPRRPNKKKLDLERMGSMERQNTPKTK